MKFGFHLSIGKGLAGAIEQARRTGCEAFQIFSRNPRSWKSKELDPEDVEAFVRLRQEAGLAPVAVHLPYLPNLASEKDDLWEKSISVLAEEFVRAGNIGADYVVVHPGHSRPEDSAEEACRRIAEAVIQASPPKEGPMLLLENTSGQKGEYGADFQELADLAGQLRSLGQNGFPVGICLDTAHAWAAGYDLATEDGLDRTLESFDGILGMKNLKLIHLNDSMSKLGGRRDRHQALGQGEIGSRGLARFVRRPEFDRLAGIMETPKKSEEDDKKNMAKAKRWRRGN